MVVSRDVQFIERANRNVSGEDSLFVEMKCGSDAVKEGNTLSLPTVEQVPEQVT